MTATATSHGFVTARDNTVDVCNDVTIAKVQFSLRKIAFGRFEICLGLFDGRRPRHQLRKDLVDIPLRASLREANPRPKPPVRLTGGYCRDPRRGSEDLQERGCCPPAMRTKPRMWV